MTTPLLSVRNLTVGFTHYTGTLGLRPCVVPAVEGLGLDIDPGEILAVIGASGSGKSLLAHAIVGILPSTANVSGEIDYDGAPLDPARLRRLRGREISFIPQSVNYLDPLMPVGRQVRLTLPRPRAAQLQQDLFARYHLDEKVTRQYPHELSGGMLRRVLFATGVTETMRLLIADEPTPGLHPAALQEVLSHLRALADDGAGVLLITHDLVSAAAIADRVAVMRSGRVVTVESSSSFTGRGETLRHEYARRLWRALPQHDFWKGVAR
ncbi:ABC transporter ATP-binding protein [Streptomyces sp. ST2-7A]|uniref:ATP-binding cassette domain-containing protein n=1 Tax=Streptomyces sp. ST2-7A TaxID=2907214 RepID=UPI001F3AABD3|nr:ABC transporter ATP-binding protein [Streptomyces sp. ST2-7A]MCE7079610.1 ABC transporter ATP-binding protein [Streptomyces sp. ST2-7A]